MNPKVSLGFQTNTDACSHPSDSSTVFPPVSTSHSPNWTAPDSKAFEYNHNNMRTALTEATKRATVAEGKAAEYLVIKENLEHQMHEHHAQAATLVATNKALTAENRTLKDSFAKLQTHTKNCEKATNKAQKDAQNAKGHANHLINSQKGQLRNAEKRYETAARELKGWKERYGWMERPCVEKAASQKRLEWQSKANKARAEIAELEKGSPGSWGRVETRQSETLIKAEEGPTSTSRMEQDECTPVDSEEQPNNTNANTDPRIASAEAKANKYKAQCDTLRRMLQDQVPDDTKLAESLVLRNAKIAEPLESWVADDGDADG